MKNSHLNNNSRRLAFALLAPGGVTILVLLAALAGDGGRVALRFDRAGLASAELWRLVSAHLVHLGWGHTLLNIGGLAALTYVLPIERLSVSWWLGVLLMSAAAIDIGLYVWHPQLAWYVGLSGVLHGLWAAGAVVLIVTGERLIGAILILVLLAKVIREQISGASELTAALSGGEVVAAAHAYGMLGGFVFVAAWLLLRKAG